MTAQYYFGTTRVNHERTQRWHHIPWDLWTSGYDWRKTFTTCAASIDWTRSLTIYRWQQTSPNAGLRLRDKQFKTPAPRYGGGSSHCTCGATVSDPSHQPTRAVPRRFLALGHQAAAKSRRGGQAGRLEATYSSDMTCSFHSHKIGTEGMPSGLGSFMEHNVRLLRPSEEVFGKQWRASWRQRVRGHNWEDGQRWCATISFTCWNVIQPAENQGSSSSRGHQQATNDDDPQIPGPGPLTLRHFTATWVKLYGRHTRARDGKFPRASRARQHAIWSCCDTEVTMGPSRRCHAI